MRPVRVSPRRKRVFSLLRGERDEEDRASRRGARFPDVHGWTSQKFKSSGKALPFRLQTGPLWGHPATAVPTASWALTRFQATWTPNRILTSACRFCFFFSPLWLFIILEMAK